MPALALQILPAAGAPYINSMHFMSFICERCGKQHTNSLAGAYYDLCEDCNREVLNAIGDTQ